MHDYSDKMIELHKIVLHGKILLEKATSHPSQQK